MSFLPADLATLTAGSLVGTVLGLVGGGGSILAVPLIVYGVGVPSAHIAIGTSAVAVAVSALSNLAGHWRAGRVKWPCAIVFSLAGMAGAFAGSTFAKSVDGQRLLGLFGLLMIGVGIMMFRKRGFAGEAGVRLSRDTALQIGPQLIGIGLGVGLLSGFFGIGGGFLIVPGLMLATGMPLSYAIGTSLVSVTAFGATTAFSYALSGLVDWRMAAIFIAGGLLGSLVGCRLGKVLAARREALGSIFAAFVVVAGIYVVLRSFA